MPIYEYRCSSCSHELESLQKLSDAPLVVCPACGQSTLVKLMSAAGFQLKGSGWYATDFKGSGSKPKAKTDGDGAKGTDAKSEGSSDTKSESKSESTAESKSESKSAVKSETKSETKSEAKSNPAAAASGTGRAGS